MRSASNITSIIRSRQGARLLQQFPQAQSLSFSTNTKKPELNILFFCPRNESHFEKFEGEYPDFIKSVNPESISVSDIAHNPENNNKAITSLLNNSIDPSVIIPHLVLIGDNKANIDKKIQFCHDSGIESILAIRGNPTTVGQERDYTCHPDGYEDMPHLMKRIKEISPTMKILVAGYPGTHPFAKNFEEDMDELKRKVDCGADGIITQHFFDNDEFLGFMNHCHAKGINLPIIPSIMPIGNPKYLLAFSEAANVAIPAKVSSLLFKKGITSESNFIEDKDIEKKAVEYTATQIQSLIDLKLPKEQMPRINTYAANNIPFLGKVFDELGIDRGKGEKER